MADPMEVVASSIISHWLPLLRKLSALLSVSVLLEYLYMTLLSPALIPFLSVSISPLTIGHTPLIAVH